LRGAATNTPGVTSSSGGAGESSGGPLGNSPAAGTVGGKLAPVRIGFTTVPDAAAFFAAFGAKTSNVDQAAMFRSAVAWVNKHGGLNGHPIDAKIEAVSATSQESYDSQYQKLCARYTQDDKVVAASNIGVGADTNMDTCMSRARTLFLTGSNTLHDDQDYAATPYVVSPYEVTASVLAKTLAQLIVNRRFEKSGGKIGLLNYDIPEYNRAFDKQLKPILAAAGIGVVRYTIPPPASTADIGNSVAVVQSAQLKMAAQGVKTVTFLCSGCAAFFIQAANSQNYYPRYVLSSMDSPGAADGATYERALRSSVSVGWEPVADYGTTAPPAPVPYSATYHQCYKIQRDAGVLTSPDQIGIAMLTCDAVLQFYYAAKANPTATITSESLRTGMLRLGTSHPSALGFATNLTPSRHAGAAQYRLMTWNDKCSCPAYSGPALVFPTL
jgi:ABC-type branched-subunit amino acid transport system substrate-binding protein